MTAPGASPAGRTRVRADAERGSMAIEVVILVPMLLMIMVLIVAFGRYVSAEGDAQSAAREAVRAASLERDEASARVTAQGTATATLPSSLKCAPVVFSGDFLAGSTVKVDLTCEVSWEGLGLIGLPGTTQVIASSSAPLDKYRRTGAP